MGMEIHKFESIPSTNSALIEFSKKNAKSWTVFWTTNQTDGRGYSGNQWLVQSGQNLAVSVLIKSELAYNELIFFNQWVSNCLQSCLSSHLDQVFVKWPNDIIAQEKKICGVLIETHKVGNELNMIIGMGININQMNFDGISKAGSMASLTHKNFNIEEILSELLTELESKYHQIEQKQWDNILTTYNLNLFRKNIISHFRSNNEDWKGIILEADNNGLLLIQLENGSIKKFQHKEVELIY